MIETQANELKNRSEMMNMLALRIEEDAGNPETSADIVEGVLEIDTASENRQKARETVLSFVQSYRHKPEGTLDAAWLDGEFSKYPTIWEDADERKNTALIVVERVQRFEEEKQKLAEYRERGLSRESYLKSAIESGAKAQGVNNVGSYAAEIDHTLDQANKDNIDLMYRRDGGINQSWHLDGFIAEQHHAESFNIEAAAQGSPYRAEVLKPAPGQTYGKNSVDIVIRDGNGKIVKRYQSKYGTDAESTKELFEKGDYRGRESWFPKGKEKTSRTAQKSSSTKASSPSLYPKRMPRNVSGKSKKNRKPSNTNGTTSTARLLPRTSVRRPVSPPCWQLASKARAFLVVVSGTA